MRASALILLALLSLLPASCTTRRMPGSLESPYRKPASLEKGQILHLETGILLSRPEVLDYLAHYPVVYVGETHDSVEDHEVELAVLQELHERVPQGVALGLEMLPRDTQPELDAYIRGEMEEESFANLWKKNWGNTFALYREILHYARARRIPVLALNIEEELKQAVRDEAPERLKPELKARLPELDLSDPYYRLVNESLIRAHEMGSGDQAVFLRIQALWDETMAQTAADFLRGSEGGAKHLLILAGGNHVRYGFGIPRRLFRLVPIPYVIVCPFAVRVSEEKKAQVMDVELPEVPLRPADFFWAVEYRGLPESGRE